MSQSTSSKQPTWQDHLRGVCINNNIEIPIINTYFSHGRFHAQISLHEISIFSKNFYENEEGAKEDVAERALAILQLCPMKQELCGIIMTFRNHLMKSCNTVDQMLETWLNTEGEQMQARVKTQAQWQAQSQQEHLQWQTQLIQAYWHGHWHALAMAQEQTQAHLQAQTHAYLEVQARAYWREQERQAHSRPYLRNQAQAQEPVPGAMAAACRRMPKSKRTQT